MRISWVWLTVVACGPGTEETRSGTAADTDSTDTCLTEPCSPTDTETLDTTPSDTDTGTPPGDGTALAVRFSIEADLAARMTEEPSGPFWGEVYRAEDVSLFGPDNGAVALGAIEISDLILAPDGSSTAVLFRLEPVPPIEIAILGFVDTDDNADPSAPDPDADDPVTLPTRNQFTLQLGVETEVTVVFGLLNP